jgi:TonB-dependent starch-binding outer membrane protein SusC
MLEPSARRFHRIGSRPIAVVVALALIFAPGARAANAQTQTGTISGSVVGEIGQPISGAQVALVGTGLGTLTNASGKYTIVNVPAAQYRIRVQMIGHRPVEDPITVTAGTTTTQNFVLKRQVIALDEVVVTGTAGAARQREVGNAVSQIDVAAINEAPANLGTLLQGRTTGATITQSSAAAGSGSMIRLRGNVSVAMSNQPLIYVDGVRLRSDGYQRNVPITGSDLRSGNDIASPMNDINPNDIERIEIIKGAAAATLYGTEAAAGVIQIFTRSGRAGKPQWTLQTDQGFVHSLPFGPDPSTAPPGDTIPQIYRDSFPSRFAGLPDRGVSRAGGTSSYLFIDPWLRNGPQKHYSVSVAGGGDALRYFASGSATNDDGVLPNDNETKRVVRGNFSFTPIPNLLFSWNTSYTQDNISNTPAGNNAHGLTLNAFRRDRNYASNDRPEVVDKLLDQEINSYINHLVTGSTITWSPTVNLSNRFTVGFDRAEIENRNLRPFGFVSAPQGILSDRYNSYQNLTLDYAGNYARQIRNGLRSTLSWGGQGVTTDSRETSAYGENFPGPGNPVVASAGTTLGFESRQRVVNAGGFGQVLFDLKNRYFLTAGLRIDGNSAFGQNLGLQTYPKLSASWVASDESYWPAAIPEMKVRFAWGQSGRAPGAFDAVRTWENAGGTGWGGQPAFFPLNVGNPDLGPERTSEIELGFDAAAFGDRVSTQFTYYSRNITDALFNARQIPSLGFLNSQLENVGTMTSSGVELTTTVTAVRRSNFEWSVGGSLYTSSNEVKSLGGAADFSLGTDAWIMKGQPIPVIRSDNTCLTNPDQKGSGGAAVVPTFSSNAAADCVYGPNLPSHTYGLFTSLQLPRGIAVDLRGEYEGGHFMYDGAGFNAVQRSVRWPGCYDFYNLQETGKIDQATALQLVRCTPSTTRSDYWIYPASYFKLRDVSVSVPIPARFVTGASAVRLTVSGHNIWKWVNKDFPVFDPETGNNGGFDTKVRSILEHVPPPALYMATLRVTF